jgi:hypothetical protein
MPSLKTLSARARALGERRGISVDGVDHVFSGAHPVDAEFGLVEHVLHELAHVLHAAPFHLEDSRAIGQHIKNLPGNERLDHEAWAWAIEWHALRLLGLVGEEIFQWADAREAAAMQGVPEYLLKRHVANDRAKRLAGELCELLVGEGEEDE